MFDVRTHMIAALFASVAVLTLAACANPPNPALERARSDYAAVAQDPTIIRNANTDLQSARSLLDNANVSYANGDDPAEVTHRAYLAAQAVQVAREDAIANQATQQLHQAQAQQEQTLADLKARQTSQGLVLTLGSLLFQSGKADLAPGAQGPIDELATFLRQNPDREVQIQGYTDNTGRDSTNLNLSRQRADAVRAALVARGISPARISAEGLGDASPVADNSTPEGRQMNRRVEVVVANANADATAASGTSAPKP
jgi:outer membrane protein OmpA-like peptidoglycan-associated protein